MLVEALKKAFLVGFSNDHRDLLTPPWRTWVATTRGLIKKQLARAWSHQFLMSVQTWFQNMLFVRVSTRWFLVAKQNYILW